MKKTTLALVAAMLVSGATTAAHAQGLVVTGASASESLGTLPPVRVSSLTGPRIALPPQPALVNGTTVLSQPAVIGEDSSLRQGTGTGADGYSIVPGGLIDPATAFQFARPAIINNGAVLSQPAIIDNGSMVNGVIEQPAVIDSVDQVLTQPAVIGTDNLNTGLNALPGGTILVKDGCNQAIILPGATGVPSLLPGVAEQAAILPTTTETMTTTTKHFRRVIKHHKRSCRRVIRRSCKRVHHGCN